MSHVPYDVGFVEALLASYAALLSEPLVPAHVPPVNAPAWLYGEADFAVVAHETGEDPRFVYANLEAQRCFERAWADFVGLPSRLSAEAPERSERAAMLAEVARHGFIRNYRGLRVASSGRRFWIERGVIWNIRDADGTPRGQAALFHARAGVPGGEPSRA